MDPIQLDFWLAGVPLALAALTSFAILLFGNRLAGLLLLLAFLFLLSHMVMATFYSNEIFSFVEVMTPYQEMEMNLTVPTWFQLFLYAKCASFAGIPVALWLLHRDRPARHP